MKIGLLGFGLADWGGGRDILRQFIAALTAVKQSHGIDLSVLVPTSVPNWPTELRFGRILKELSRTGAALQAKHLIWALHSRRVGSRKLDLLIDELGLSASRLVRVQPCRSLQDLPDVCRSLRLDALLACLPDLGPDFPVPWCGYLPDVQHKRLPHMFGAAEIEQRDAHFSATVAHSDAIIATSSAVADDLAEFFGPLNHCTVLPLAWLPLEHPSTQGRRKATGRYGVAGRYFIVCNQFWRHKDHETAFRAFAQVRRLKENADVVLVCTGDKSDYRHFDHFIRMEAILDELEIAPHVRILGRIPKEDQLALLDGSIALIQPSLFEGTRGGLAVADALALDRPCIVSDIVVNRELDEPGVRYFQAGSPEDLSRQMIMMLADPPPVRTLPEQHRICERRLQDLGESLVRAANSAMAARRSQQGGATCF